MNWSCFCATVGPVDGPLENCQGFRGDHRTANAMSPCLRDIPSWRRRRVTCGSTVTTTVRFPVLRPVRALSLPPKALRCRSRARPIAIPAMQPYCPSLLCLASAARSCLIPRATTPIWGAYCCAADAEMEIRRSGSKRSAGSRSLRPSSPFHQNPTFRSGRASAMAIVALLSNDRRIRDTSMVAAGRFQLGPAVIVSHSPIAACCTAYCLCRARIRSQSQASVFPPHSDQPILRISRTTPYSDATAMAGERANDLRGFHGDVLDFMFECGMRPRSTPRCSCEETCISYFILEIGPDTSIVFDDTRDVFSVSRDAFRRPARCRSDSMAASSDANAKTDHGRISNPDPDAIKPRRVAGALRASVPADFGHHRPARRDNA